MNERATDEVLTGYSKILEALTEKGRWQAQRIRELEAQVEQGEKWQVELIAKWLWADVLYRQYKGDCLEANKIADGHKKSCADALARSLEATEECLRMGGENRRMREALQRLYDEQNGPPLLQWKKSWETAMAMASEVLEGGGG